MIKITHNLKLIKFLFCLLLIVVNLNSQTHVKSFNTENWELEKSVVLDTLGRNCLAGWAELKNYEFENGTIEYDVFVTGARSYPGIFFRIQSEFDSERFYIRPHRAGLYGDALQYSPVINKVTGWQLYAGKGFTAGAKIEKEKWVHHKIVVDGSKAEVFIGKMDTPALKIDRLVNGKSSGAVGILCPRNGSAFISNFQISKSFERISPDSADIQSEKNVIRNWEISEAKKMKNLDLQKLNYPGFFSIYAAGFEKIESDCTGLIDVVRRAKRSPGGSDFVMARSFVYSDERQNVQLSFGYSDEIVIFHNSKKVFYGNSSYKKRDSGFSGIVGYNDAVYLTLEKGVNEIFLLLKESFGGWGFKFKSDKELKCVKKDYSQLEKIWETPQKFKTPESVTYDEKRKIFYVSNFDIGNRGFRKLSGFISKVGIDGKIIDLHWADSLKAPCGIGISEDFLFTVERGCLTKIDITSGEIIKRYPVESSEFLNDLVVTENGVVYFTDTKSSQPEKSCIYKLENEKIVKWIDNIEVNRANGLTLDGDNLLLGSSGDGLVKSINIKTGIVKNIISVGAGVIDGIKTSGADYLISLWEGKIYKLDKNGELIEIFNRGDLKINTADFEFFEDENLLIIPTFLENKLVAFKLKK